MVGVARCGCSDFSRNYTVPHTTVVDWGTQGSTLTAKYSYDMKSAADLYLNVICGLAVHNNIDKKQETLKIFEFLSRYIRNGH